MMRKAGTINPIFLLDEIDKMSMDFRGDPSAALLEVLDPEQNDSFLDHYLDVDYDLSKVMFIATANVIHSIPAPLRDRMEVIQLSGYTLNEKLAIAKQFLVPRQLRDHGLSTDNIHFDEEAIRVVIESYTREAGGRGLGGGGGSLCRTLPAPRGRGVAGGAAGAAGVRSRGREVGSICRKIARRVVKEGRSIEVTVTTEMIFELLGKPKFRARRKNQEAEGGGATGLAWTEVGGELLETEVGLMPGKGKLTLTGKLGDVMQESARAAVSYLRSRSAIFGVERAL